MALGLNITDFGAHPAGAGDREARPRRRRQRRHRRRSTSRCTARRCATSPWPSKGEGGGGGGQGAVFVDQAAEGGGRGQDGVGDGLRRAEEGNGRLAQGHRHRQGPLQGHAGGRQDLRQLVRPRRAGAVPAERRHPVLDRGRAEDGGRRQGQADLPAGHRLRRPRQPAGDPARGDARVRGRAARGGRPRHAPGAPTAAAAGRRLRPRGRRRCRPRRRRRSRSALFEAYRADVAGLLEHGELHLLR